MILGIDASNIRAGGGVTHLIELLAAANPEIHGFSKVILWGGQSTLNQVAERPWLLKQHLPILDKSFIQRAYWKIFQLSNLARHHRCDLLFIPCGSYIGSFQPMVTMSQNLLPFYTDELLGYRSFLTWPKLWLKLAFLKRTQAQTFRSADGVIFLSHHSKSVVERFTGSLGQTKVIAHGLNKRFLMSPRSQKSVESCSVNQPFRLIYVSIINHYKHQWNVVEAVATLRQLTGWHLALDLVGPAYPSALPRLQASLTKHDPDGRWAHYHGPLPYNEIHFMYAKADVGLWASTCETFGMILLETMGAGLPVASSNHKVSQEILGQAGVYFNATNPQDIVSTLQRLIASPELRTQLATASFVTAQQYTWEHCADQTFEFLAAVHRQYSQKSKASMP
jgi:glycosyltransferase involved in cell wall biosynthesis